MAYFIRVLSPNPEPMQASILRNALAADGHRAILSGEAPDGTWGQLVVTHPDGTEICIVERDVVAESGAGRFEIEEFLEEIGDTQPASAAEGLAGHLQSARSIYAIQTLRGTYERNGWDIVGCLRTAIWKTSGGIIRAETEGPSNEEGYHTLWQFSDSVESDWWMAALDNGEWRKFRLDLGNTHHRACFFRGEIPPGAETAT